MCKFKIMCSKVYMQIKEIINEEECKQGWAGFHLVKPDFLSLSCLHSMTLSFLAFSDANRWPEYFQNSRSFNLEVTYMKQGGFNHLSQLFNLLFTATNITVSDIRLFFHLHNKEVREQLPAWCCKSLWAFNSPQQNSTKGITRQSHVKVSKGNSHLHHGDCGINLWRQGNMDLVLVSVHPGEEA